MIETLIISIALQQGIDPNILLGICYQESHFHTANLENDGPTGETAHSVCQVHPVAAKQVGLEHLNLDIPSNSILVAARYYKYQLNRCGSVVPAVAAYNTGHCIIHPKKDGYVDHVLEYSRDFEFKRYASIAFN